MQLLPVRLCTQALLALALAACCNHALAIGRQSFVVLDRPANGVALIKDGAAATLFVDPLDHPGVLRAAGDLRADLDRAGARNARLTRSARAPWSTAWSRPARSTWRRCAASGRAT
jgi:hypothetical protein